MKMNLIKETLRTISNYPGGYGMLYELIYNEKPSQKSSNSLRTTISRLHKKGLISKKGEKWHITNDGKTILSKGKNTHHISLNKNTRQRNQKTL